MTTNRKSEAMLSSEDWKGVFRAAIVPTVFAVVSSSVTIVISQARTSEALTSLTATMAKLNERVDLIDRNGTAFNRENTNAIKMNIGALERASTKLEIKMDSAVMQLVSLDKNVAVISRDVERRNREPSNAK